MSPSVRTTAKGRESDCSATRLAARRIGSNLSAKTADGDDLTRARLFCLAARSEMTEIIDADRSDARQSAKAVQRPLRGRDPVWICERLDAIQRHAKRARARAVYRSAQDVMALIERSNDHLPIDWIRVDGRLFVLNKLLSQYEDGLQEVAPTSDISERVADARRRSSVETDAVIAKTTLTTLLPHAAPDERAALTRLMDIDLSVSDVQPSDTDALALSKDNIAEPSNSPETRGDDGVEPIDFMLPALMQRLLGVGQQFGKVLSLSHALDDVWITKIQRDAVETILFDRLSELITGSLPLQGVGRLDIGQAETGLAISGSGFEAFTLGLPDNALQPAPIIDPVPQPAPRITDETEVDLRAQLAALMDGAIMGDATLEDTRLPDSDTKPPCDGAAS